MGSWDLAIVLDRTAKEPLYLQLVKALEEGIRTGYFFSFIPSAIDSSLSFPIFSPN